MSAPPNCARRHSGMADRLLRDELVESDRWLDLPSDSARLAYVGLLLRCDDFGNVEATRSLYRYVRGFVRPGGKECSEADYAEIARALAAADMVRVYAVDNREYWHLPRLRTSRTYLSRKCPVSPWCDESVALGKSKRKAIQSLAQNVVATLQAQSSNEPATLLHGNVSREPQPPKPLYLSGVDAATPVDKLTGQDSIAKPELDVTALRQRIAKATGAA